MKQKCDSKSFNYPIPDDLTTQLCFQVSKRIKTLAIITCNFPFLHWDTCVHEGKRPVLSTSSSQTSNLKHWLCLYSARSAWKRPSFFPSSQDSGSVIIRQLVEADTYVHYGATSDLAGCDDSFIVERQQEAVFTWTLSIWEEILHLMLTCTRCAPVQLVKVVCSVKRSKVTTWQ